MYEFTQTDLNYRHVSSMPNPEDFKMHIHNRFEILYAVHGGGTFVAEGVEYPITDGTIFLTRPREVHRIYPDPTVNYDRILIHFSKELIACADPNGILLEPFYKRDLGCRLSYRTFEFSGTDMRRLFHNMQGNPDNAEEQRVKIISSLFFLLQNIRNAFYSKEHSQTLNSSGKINGILQYINENLIEELTLDDIAANMYISRSQLTRTFKKAVGSTINEYITVKRLTLAQQLIMGGSTVSSACYRCGFKDYSSFF